eukprot:g635.t1
MPLLRRRLSEPSQVTHLHLGIIGALGALVVVLIIVVIYCYYKKKRRNSRWSNKLSEPLLDESQRESSIRPSSEKGPKPAVEMMSKMWKSQEERESSHREDVKDDWLIGFDDITIKQRIGQGQFGTVFAGIYHDDEVAVKKMTLSSESEALKKELSQAQVEIRILWSLRHPNVLLLYGSAFTKDHITGEDVLYLVTELCSGSLDVYVGTDANREEKLRDAMRQGMPAYSYALVLSMIKGVASALAFMHSKKVIHRDLKPDNIFVSKAGKAKIGDFGLSRILHAGTSGLVDSQNRLMVSPMTANIGSPAFMAPELLSETSLDTQYDSAIDIYSFAIIVNVLVRREKAYQERDFRGALHLLQCVNDDHRPFIPNHCPPCFVEVMRQCWQTDPSERLSASGVVSLLADAELPPEQPPSRRQGSKRANRPTTANLEFSDPQLVGAGFGQHANGVAANATNASNVSTAGGGAAALPEVPMLMTSHPLITVVDPTTGADITDSADFNATGAIMVPSAAASGDIIRTSGDGRTLEQASAAAAASASAGKADMIRTSGDGKTLEQASAAAAASASAGKADIIRTSGDGRTLEQASAAAAASASAGMATQPKKNKEPRATMGMFDSQQEQQPKKKEPRATMGMFTASGTNISVAGEQASIEEEQQQQQPKKNKEPRATMGMFDSQQEQQPKKKEPRSTMGQFTSSGTAVAIAGQQASVEEESGDGDDL